MQISENGIVEKENRAPAQAPQRSLIQLFLRSFLWPGYVSQRIHSIRVKNLQFISTCWVFRRRPTGLLALMATMLRKQRPDDTNMCKVNDRSIEWRWRLELSKMTRNQIIAPRSIHSARLAYVSCWRDIWNWTLRRGRAFSGGRGGNRSWSDCHCAPPTHVRTRCTGLSWPKVIQRTFSGDNLSLISIKMKETAILTRRYKNLWRKRKICERNAKEIACLHCFQESSPSVANRIEYRAHTTTLKLFGFDSNRNWEMITNTSMVRVSCWCVGFFAWKTCSSFVLVAATIVVCVASSSLMCDTLAN